MIVPDSPRLQANSCKWTPIHSHFLHISLYRFTFTQNQVALFSYSTLSASPCTRCKLCTSHLFSCLVPHLAPALACGKKMEANYCEGGGGYEAESRAVISRPALQLLVRHKGEGGAMQRNKTREGWREIWSLAQICHSQRDVPWPCKQMAGSMCVRACSHSAECDWCTVSTAVRNDAVICQRVVSELRCQAEVETTASALPITHLNIKASSSTSQPRLNYHYKYPDW